MRCAYLVQLDQPYPSQNENERRREDMNLIRLKKRHDCGGVVLRFGWETTPTGLRTFTPFGGTRERHLQKILPGSKFLGVHLPVQ